MGRVLAIVMAASPPLRGSSRAPAFERFCGLPLAERAHALAEEACPGATVVRSVRAERLGDLVRAHADDLAGYEVVLAIDPRAPLLGAGTLARLVAGARGGLALAAGPVALAVAVAELDLAASPAQLDAPERELHVVTGKGDLVSLERAAYLLRNQELLEAGLLIRDPASTRVNGPLTFGIDVEIRPGCTLEGPVALGDRVVIGEGCRVSRATLGDDVDVRPFTLIEDATIGAHSFVGPYARVRPGTTVGHRSQIGNFVELKAAHLGDRARVNHLSFVGDAEVERDVTIGAGTITCNHDGVGVQQTSIGAGAYVGSGCILVAPIAIGEGATVGTGTPLTEDAPANRLSLARARQVVVESWKGFKKENP